MQLPLQAQLQGRILHTQNANVKNANVLALRKKYALLNDRV